MKLRTLLKFIPVVVPLVLAAPVDRHTENTNHTNLRGSESLVGYSSSNKVTNDSPPEIKYTLLPGQKEDPKVGSYLDFQTADNPQPIRGSTGSDDPGPSTFASIPLEL